MRQIRFRFGRLTRTENGATMVEYGMMVALIAIICIASIALLGNALSTIFGRIPDHLIDAVR